MKIKGNVTIGILGTRLATKVDNALRCADADRDAGLVAVVKSFTTGRIKETLNVRSIEMDKRHLGHKFFGGTRHVFVGEVELEVDR